MPIQNESRWKITLAFVVLYLTWSSTFIGIRFAVAAIPPATVGFIRHFGAGLFLFLVCYGLSPHPSIQWKQWRNALLIGTITNGISNGCLIWSEVTIPSSLAAVAFTTMPLFMVLFNWKCFERIVPHPLDLLAIALGILGTCLALSVTDEVRGLSLSLKEGLILISCPLVWALGSLTSRRLSLPSQPLVSASLQMIGGGFFLFVIAMVGNEWERWSVISTPPSAWAGAIYLLIFGSLIGYSAFSFLIQRVDTRLVGTYAFVNPTIAFLLAGMAGERVMNTNMILGASITISSAILLFVRAYFVR